MKFVYRSRNILAAANMFLKCLFHFSLHRYLVDAVEQRSGDKLGGRTAHEWPRDWGSWTDGRADLAAHDSVLPGHIQHEVLLKRLCGVLGIGNESSYFGAGFHKINASCNPVQSSPRKSRALESPSTLAYYCMWNTKSLPV